MDLFTFTLFKISSRNVCNVIKEMLSTSRYDVLLFVCRVVDQRCYLNVNVVFQLTFIYVPGVHRSGERIQD